MTRLALAALMVGTALPAAAQDLVHLRLAFDPAASEHHHDVGDLATIQQPTLLIQGDRDPVVPLEDAVAMYETSPNSALWIVPNATHFMGMEGWRRHAFETEIMRFLRRGS